MSKSGWDDREWRRIRRLGERLSEVKPRSSGRLVDVLERLVSGLEAKEIARTLRFSVRTIEKDFAALNRAYGTSNVRQIVSLATLDYVVEAAADLGHYHHWQHAQLLLAVVLKLLGEGRSGEALRLRADALRYVADLERGKGNHAGGTGAIALYDQAMTLYQELATHWERRRGKNSQLARGFWRDYADAAWMRSLCIRKTWGLTKGLEALRNAEDVFGNTKTDTDWIIGNLRRDQARMHDLLHSNPRNVASLLDESEARLKGTDDMTGLGMTYVRKGTHELLMGEYEDARMFVERGLDLIPRDAAHHLIGARVARARILHAAGERVEALGDLEEALRIARSYRFGRALTEIERLKRRLERASQGKKGQA